MNSYIQLQTTRKLSLFYADCLILLLSVSISIFFFWLGFPVIAFCDSGGEAESTHSDLFTYTSDMVEDSASSGHSRSTPSVNQPLQGEQAMPPALPAGEAEAGPSHITFPYHEEEVIGGDSVLAIERRLLAPNEFPSDHDIRLARIQAEDLFEVKVDIIRVMAGLNPSGDWMGRGARALDNPRTATGEESLERLYQLLFDLQTAGLQSATFRQLVERVPLRADGDQHSAA